MRLIKNLTILLILLLNTSLVLALNTQQFIQTHNLQTQVFPNAHALMTVMDAQGRVLLRPIQHGDFYQYQISSKTSIGFVWENAYLLDDNFNIQKNFNLNGQKIGSTGWINKDAHTSIIDTSSLQPQDYHFLYYVCDINHLNMWWSQGPFDCKWELDSFSLGSPTPQQGKYGLSDPNNLGPKTNPNIPCITPNDGDKIDKDTTLCPGVYNFKKGLQIVKSGITLDCNGAILDGDNNGQKSPKGIWNEMTGHRSFGGSYCDKNDVLESLKIKNCELKNYETGMDVCTSKTSFENNKAEKNSLGIKNYDSLTSVSGGGYNWHPSELNTYKNNIFENNHIGIQQEGESNTIENNKLSNNHWGMDSQGNAQSLIKNNEFAQNNYGLVSGHYQNFIENNLFTNNKHIGIKVNDRNSRFLQNKITGSEKGIETYGVSNLIEDNLIEKNNKGIYVYIYNMFFNQPTTIKNNVIKENDYGIDLEDNSNSKTPQRTTVMKNDFENNKIQIYSDFVNFIDKNYYSDYSQTCVNNNPADNYCDIKRPVDGGATDDLKPLAVKSSTLNTPKQTTGCVTPTNGMQINQDTKLCQGYYSKMDKGLTITKDNIVLDCQGATLNGLIRQVSSGGRITYIVGSNGIFWNNLNNVEVKNCNIEFYGTGIRGLYTHGSSIHDNDINMAGYGIELYKGTSNEVNNNRISSTYTGIKLFEIDTSDIFENFLMFNTIGIHLEQSIQNNVNDNTILHSRFVAPITTDSPPQYNTNGVAILIDYESNDNFVFNNKMDQNKLGVWVRNSNNNMVNDNEIKNNIGTSKPHVDGIGIYVEADKGSAEKNEFIHNTITNSDQAGVLVLSYLGGGSIQNNNFYHNNFLKNPLHAHDEFDNEWDDGSLGNYWDDHIGVKCNDANSDGICDNYRNIDPSPYHNKDDYPSAKVI